LDAQAHPRTCQRANPQAGTLADQLPRTEPGRLVRARKGVAAQTRKGECFMTHELPRTPPVWSSAKRELSKVCKVLARKAPPADNERQRDRLGQGDAKRAQDAVGILDHRSTAADPRTPLGADQAKLSRWSHHEQIDRRSNVLQMTLRSKAVCTASHIQLPLTPTRTTTAPKGSPRRPVQSAWPSLGVVALHVAIPPGLPRIL